jgi:DHA1 family multidrug resistance protein-like MFS transporter
MALAFGYSLTNPCLSALISKAAPLERQGSVLGLYQSGGSLARVMAPLLAGSLYDRRMEYPFISGIAFVMVAGFVLTGRLFFNKSSSTI